MKAEIHGVDGKWWYWEITKDGKHVADCGKCYTRRRDAKRGLIRFLKGMKKGVEVPE